MRLKIVGVFGGGSVHSITNTFRHKIGDPLCTESITTTRCTTVWTNKSTFQPSLNYVPKAGFIRCLTNYHSQASSIPWKSDSDPKR